MKLLGPVIACVAMAGAVAAQESNLRIGELQLDYAAATDMASDRTLVYYDGGQSKFSSGGSYSYTYAGNGGVAFGRFEVKLDGRICIDFRNGHSRCDMYIRRSGMLLLITEKGDRFPIRVEFKLQP